MSFTFSAIVLLSSAILTAKAMSIVWFSMALVSPLRNSSCASSVVVMCIGFGFEFVRFDHHPCEGAVYCGTDALEGKLP